MMYEKIGESIEEALNANLNNVLVMLLGRGNSPRRGDLYRAIKGGNNYAAKILLEEAGLEIDTKYELPEMAQDKRKRPSLLSRINPFGNNKRDILLQAVEENQNNVLASLLKRRHDLKISVDAISAAFHAAVVAKNFQAAKLLLEAGAMINGKTQRELEEAHFYVPNIRIF